MSVTAEIFSSETFWTANEAPAAGFLLMAVQNATFTLFAVLSGLHRRIRADKGLLSFSKPNSDSQRPRCQY